MVFCVLVFFAFAFACMDFDGFRGCSLYRIGVSKNYVWLCSLSSKCLKLFNLCIILTE